MDTNKNKPTTSKRHHSELSSDPDSDSDHDPTLLRHSTQQLPAEWSRFLVLESSDPDRPLSKLSPFAIAKALQGLAGEPKSLKKLHSGQLLVECDKRAHSANLLRTSCFIDIPITVTPHRTMNSCRGVVRSRDLDGTSESEMVENLKHQGVTTAKRISVRRGETLVATNTYVLTFNSPTLPRSIKAGFINIPVDHYIPNPLRCFKCQRFGHHKDKCRREAVCARCGQGDHDSSSCTKLAYCINCSGNHTAFDRNCPKWIAEKEVQRVKITNGLSFPEARKLVESRVPTGPSGKTFADAAKVVEPSKSQKSVEVQTDITWPSNADKFSIIKPKTVPSPSTQSSSSSSQTLDKTLSVSKEPVPSGKPKPRVRTTSKAQSDRQSKGSEDPIQQHNRFGVLVDMDTTDVSKARRHKPEPPPPKPSLVRLPTNPS